MATGYDPDDQVNLSGFAGSLTAYVATAATVVTLLRSRGRRAPEGYPLSDVVLGGLATHKFSRLLARGSVTSPLRAPFTEFQGAAGSAEHQESARDGHGLRHTVGELATCPFCLGVWIGTGYVASLAGAPRGARAWAATFSVVAVSDFLNQAYDRLRTD